MREVSILRYALPSSDWITQDRGCGTSVVSIKAQAQDHPEGLTIVSVHRNWVPLRHRVLDPVTVAVSPALRLEGERLEVLCLAPDTAQKAPNGVPRCVGSPEDRYGLQAPNHRYARNRA